MSPVSAPAPYLTALWERLETLRRVVLVGLPGTGKSLLVKELARAATESGRCAHVLQWDVSRRAWESNPATSERYPEIDGVTHAGVRVAMGSWVRSAVAVRDADRVARELLVVEAPLIGGRFSELAAELDDDAERTLADPSTQFVVIAPVHALREKLRAQRAQDMAAAGEDNLEQHNASADLLDELTDSLREAARVLGVEARSDSGYDIEMYVELMQKVLRHRHSLVVRPDTLIKVTGSVYELGGEVRRVWPEAARVRRTLREVGARSDLELTEHVDRWYLT